MKRMSDAARRTFIEVWLACRINRARHVNGRTERVTARRARYAPAELDFAQSTVVTRWWSCARWCKWGTRTRVVPCVGVGFVVQSLPARGEEEGTMVQGTATLSLILPPFMEAVSTSRDASSSRMQRSAGSGSLFAPWKRLHCRPAAEWSTEISWRRIWAEEERKMVEKIDRRRKCRGPVLPIERYGGTRPMEKERQRGEGEWATPCLNPRESL